MDTTSALMYYAAENYLQSIAVESLKTKIETPTNATVNGKVFNIWFKQFKPEWKYLQDAINHAKTPEEKKKLLWKEKELLLNTRKAAVGIEENLWVNIAAMVGILTVTIGLAVIAYNKIVDLSPLDNPDVDPGMHDEVTSEVVSNSSGGKMIRYTHKTAFDNDSYQKVYDTGYSTYEKAWNKLNNAETDEDALVARRALDKLHAMVKNEYVNDPSQMRDPQILSLGRTLVEKSNTVKSSIAIVSGVMGTVYTVLKFLGMGISNKSANKDLAANQKFGGVMTKQFLVNRINSYISSVDAQLQALQGGKNIAVDQTAVKAANKYSTKYMNEIAEKVEKSA